MPPGNCSAPLTCYQLLYPTSFSCPWGAASGIANWIPPGVLGPASAKDCGLPGVLFPRLAHSANSALTDASDSDIVESPSEGSILPVITSAAAGSFSAGPSLALLATTTATSGVHGITTPSLFLST